MNNITLVRRIKARPSIVFDALTTVEGIAAWWGPDELPVVRAEVDARVDGAYLVRFGTLDGREHVAYGTFLELVPPRRIIMTYQYALGGEPDERGRTSRIKFELVAVAGGTELTFTHTDLAGDVSARSHASGWTGAFHKLVRNMDNLDNTERVGVPVDLTRGEQT